jgi:16S rRNA (adenine1518-N6/adenine1519-N6)-dimethyltransferase
MDITSRKAIKNLIKKHQIRLSKRLGQNFLVNRKVIEKIIEAAQLSPDDTVLEIGPGIGNLTIELAKKVKKVIAVEKDQKMIEILKETLKDFKNVEIIQGDILKFQISDFGFRISPKVVANLPYYIVSPVIRKFLESTELRALEIILMVQKEVAQRICPRPPKLRERRRGKTSKMSILAVSVQFYAEPKIITFISKKSFWPSPKVDSAIIKIVPRQFRVQVSRQFRERFFRIAKAGFSHPRKQLINNLSKGLKIDREKIKNLLLKNNIKPEQRAETLTVENWISLTKSFHFVVK